MTNEGRGERNAAREPLTSMGRRHHTRTLRVVPIVVLASSFVVPHHGTGAAAQPTTAGSQIDALLATSGNVLIKQFYELGRVSGAGRVGLEAVVFTPAGRESERLRGMRVELVGEGRDGRTDMRFVDFDEVEKLVEALQVMSETAGKWRGTEKLEYTEMDFATRSGLRIGFYQLKRDQGAFVAAGFPAPVRVFVDTDELPRIRTFLQRGLSLLNSK